MTLSDIQHDNTVSLYIKEMAQEPLLSRDEELDLAKAIEAGREAKEILRNNGHHHGDERTRLQETVERGEESRRHLIRANTRLVVSVAKRYTDYGVPFLDLIQEGNLGLMKAVEKYDYTKGHKFSTYANWWIRQRVSRAVADQGRTIRIPIHRGREIQRVYKARRRAMQRIGRTPTLEEIADEMVDDLSAEDVEKLLSISQQFNADSLDRPGGDDEDGEALGWFIADEGPAPDDVTQDGLLAARLEEQLETLSPREAKILRLHYGLGPNNEPHTLQEIGEIYGVTRERIRQIEVEALRRLRHPSRSRDLREFLD
jgi:RNA polymerase primary sigma factor